MVSTQEKYQFSEGRQHTGVVASEVAAATGIPLVKIFEFIPELTQEHLAAGASWVSESFGDGPVGEHNAQVSEGWVVVRVPEWNVAGNKSNDMSGVMRSHAISRETGEIHSFEDFFEVDEWLAASLGYLSLSDAALRQGLNL